MLQWLETACTDAGVPLSTELLADGVSELVLRDITQAQLLAIGRCGHGHIDDSKSLGHNFRRIANHVHVPMLVGGRTTTCLLRLLLAYDGQAHADGVLAWTAKLQHCLSAEVIVLNACEGTESRQVGGGGKIEDRLAQSDLETYHFLTSQGRPSTEMAAIAAAKDADLIILGRYRHPH